VPQKTGQRTALSGFWQYPGTSGEGQHGAGDHPYGKWEAAAGVRVASDLKKCTGEGASTPVIIGPFLFLVGLSARVHPALIAIAIGFGNSLGGSNMFNGYGALISRSLVDEFANAAGYPTEFSGKMSLYLLINSIIAFGVLFLISHLI